MLKYRISHEEAGGNPRDVDMCKSVLVEKGLIVVLVDLHVNEFMERTHVTTSCIFPTDCVRHGLSSLDST